MFISDTYNFLLKILLNWLNYHLWRYFHDRGLLTYVSNHPMAMCLMLRVLHSHVRCLLGSAIWWSQGVRSGVRVSSEWVWLALLPLSLATNTTQILWSFPQYILQVYDVLWCKKTKYYFLIIGKKNIHFCGKSYNAICNEWVFWPIGLKYGDFVPDPWNHWWHFRVKHKAPF